MKHIDSSIIDHYRAQLDNHPVYDAVQTLQDLQIFMQHHVYSVWDFMSLIKYLQSIIAPTRFPWTPRGDGNVRRFINELVLEEESDQTMQGDQQHSSHFELYQQAMREIGADTRGIETFIRTLQQSGLQTALDIPEVPVPSANFTRKTFSFINKNHAHEVAAALALGREHIIPGMFRAILDKIGVTAEQAPIFHFYLNRHIHLDEDFHAPLSLRLLNSLCEDDPAKFDQALEAADEAVQARLKFWDSVTDVLSRQHRKSA